MNSNQLLYKWIGKQIAKYRKEKKLSQTDLAELLQLSRGSIANIERGRQQAPLHVIWTIAEQLDVTGDKLLPIDNEHLTKDTSELITQVHQMDNLTEENKKLLSKFLENNL
ncbi:MAG: helix-turn-helix transcriptional regulator [Lewinellaceae bacterium]|nr:helix-turn-helix transcriptional regulator [Lewinellaceae bacterium]